MLAPEVATILEAVPEFVDRYLELVEAVDGDPGAPATFTELADYLVGNGTGPGSSPAVVARCMSAIERVARESNDAEELVGWAFLDCLSPEDRAHLGPWLGPRTLELAETVGLETP